MWQLEDDKTNRQYTYFQFGIQRTGTTIVDRVIKDTWNYWKANDAFPLKDPYKQRPPQYDCLVWKHAINIPDNFVQGAPTVLIYKNPYTWAESMAFRKGAGNGGWGFTYGHEAEEHMYPQPNHWNTISVPGQGSVNIGQLMYTYKHWFETWLPYHEANQDTSVLIRYEDLLIKEKRQEIFSNMAQKFSWPEHEGDFVWPEHVGSSQPMTEERTQYYIEGKPTDERFFIHGDRFVKSIRDILSPDLIQRLGYQVL